MTAKDKLELVEGYERAYGGIAQIIAALPDEALSFMPPIPDVWSTNDHLVHLLDSDLSVCFRIRVSIAQPGFLIPLWEEEDWHERLHYEAQSGRDCFALAVGLRKTTAATLKALLDKDWNEYHVVHPRNGKMGIVDLLKLYWDHGKTHEGFIKRNREAWEHR